MYMYVYHHTEEGIAIVGTEGIYRCFQHICEKYRYTCTHFTWVRFVHVYVLTDKNVNVVNSRSHVR